MKRRIKGNRLMHTYPNSTTSLAETERHARIAASLARAGYSVQPGNVGGRTVARVIGPRAVEIVDRERVIRAARLLLPALLASAKVAQ